jgi:hypothetical protein
VCAGKQDLPPSEHQVTELGTMQKLWGQRIGSVELRVVLFFLPVVSCFSIWDLERTLFLAGYGTQWMPMEIP